MNSPWFLKSDLQATCKKSMGFTFEITCEITCELSHLRLLVSCVKHGVYFTFAFLWVAAFWLLFYRLILAYALFGNFL